MKSTSQSIGSFVYRQMYRRLQGNPHLGPLKFVDSLGLEPLKSVDSLGLELRG